MFPSLRWNSYWWKSSAQEFNLSEFKKKHFSLVSFNPVWQTRLKIARLSRVSSVASLARIPMSFTHWAHWSVLTTWYRYSRMKLGKADTNLLRPCASLLWAKVLLAKLNASTRTDRWSAICNQWYAWEQLVCRIKTSPPKLRCVWKGTNRTIVVGIIIHNQTVEFPVFHRKR